MASKWHSECNKVLIVVYKNLGGGIIGLSTAFHLTQFGYKNVVVLERNEITSGTTWHSNGSKLSL